MSTQTKHKPREANLRTQWVTALTNGSYKPTKARCMSKDGEYCPLGVLADLFVKMFPGRLKVTKDAQGRTLYDDSAFVLPAVIAEVVGLAGQDGAFRDRKHKYTFDEMTECSLATVFDRGASFSEIAGIINAPETHLFL